VELRPLGERLDANRADGPSLRRLFVAAGESPAASDSVADAILDWRDADDEPRPAGAEGGDYPDSPRPRNAPFANVRELQRVRGLSRRGAHTLLAVDEGPVCLAHATRVVLASLPGATPALVERIVQAREGADAGPALRALADQLSFTRDSGGAPTGGVAGMIAISEPVHWVLRSSAEQGNPAVTAVVELIVAPLPPRVAVVRRRTWIE
jgi:type II secretory pathway component PulK